LLAGSTQTGKFYFNKVELGNGTKIGSRLPVLVPHLSGVIALAAGFSNSLALKADGTFRVWGFQQYLPLPHRTISGIELKVNQADTDNDGMPDAWEIAHFSNLSQAAFADPDFDGLTNIQEYAVGSDPNLEDADQDRLTDLVDPYPNDFYNGVAPLITILSGDNQTTLPGQFNANALDVAVWDPTGTTPYVNAPVTFEVLSGGGQLATTNVGSPALAPTLTVNTDIDGSASAHYQQPVTAGVVSQIRASASTTQVVFTSASHSAADTTPPSVPAGLFTTGLTETAFTLNWAAATDNVGVTGYDIFQGGAFIGNATLTEFNVTGLSPATTYSMTVKARDAADNLSAASTALSVTTLTPPDTTAPSIPAGLAASNLDTTGFTLSWDASTDDIGVTGYDIFKDGEVAPENWTEGIVKSKPKRRTKTCPRKTDVSSVPSSKPK
jgi:hypothetical protein